MAHCIGGDYSYGFPSIALLDIISLFIFLPSWGATFSFLISSCFFFRYFSSFHSSSFFSSTSIYLSTDHHLISNSCHLNCCRIAIIMIDISHNKHHNNTSYLRFLSPILSLFASQFVVAKCLKGWI